MNKKLITSNIGNLKKDINNYDENEYQNQSLSNSNSLNHSQSSVSQKSPKPSFNNNNKWNDNASDNESNGKIQDDNEDPTDF